MKRARGEVLGRLLAGVLNLRACHVEVPRFEEGTKILNCLRLSLGKAETARPLPRC